MKIENMKIIAYHRKRHISIALKRWRGIEKKWLAA
jgi:hypothetical protein